jgi:1-deoxy-D-xylulose-5-phosphate reductoisomerase
MNIVLLGSTGSIGTSTLKVIDENLNNFSLLLLSAHSNYELMIEQCKKYEPIFAYLENKDSSKILREGLIHSGSSTKILNSRKELNEVIAMSDTDIVVAGMVGVAGLEPVHTAIASGKRVLLANKESYVVAGELLNELAKSTGATIFPIDSEHSAIHQCLEGSLKKKDDVSRILLTGSGGPFRTTDSKLLGKITPEEAVAHPVWNMGKKISVDSATMMNKGLELIEARWLFDIDNIEIIIHPEGIIHSLVEYNDYSVIAQLSVPDMKIPIAYGLGFPDRITSGSEQLDLLKIGSLNFYEPDSNKFPCLHLSKMAMQSGGTAPAVLNAANEVAVSAFLDNRIGFLEIHDTISFVMDKIDQNSVKEIGQIVEVDLLARKMALECIENI